MKMEWPTRGPTVQTCALELYYARASQTYHKREFIRVATSIRQAHKDQTCTQATEQLLMQNLHDENNSNMRSTLLGLVWNASGQHHPAANTAVATVQ